MPVEGGTTSGGGLRDAGNSVTVVASPNAGYSFVNWTDGGAAVSTSASYTFPATAHRTLVANFIVTPTFAVSVSATPAIGGSVKRRRQLSRAAASATVVAVEIARLCLRRVESRRHSGEQLRELHVHCRL